MTITYYQMYNLDSVQEDHVFFSCWRLRVYIENNESWDTIYLDLAKAFDKVSHPRLLQKLSAYGIQGKVHSWISDFLTSRNSK